MTITIKMHEHHWQPIWSYVGPDRERGSQELRIFTYRCSRCGEVGYPVPKP